MHMGKRTFSAEARYRDECATAVVSIINVIVIIIIMIIFILYLL